MAIFKSRQTQPEEGQALVEFTLVLPVLLLLMLAAYFIGAAMYTGANASSALRAALQAKSDYADSENPLANFKATVNSYNTGTFRIPGSTVDSVSVTATDQPTAVIVAQKAVSFPLFPTFNFTVTQGIKSNLISNNINPEPTGVVNVPYDTSHPQTASTIAPPHYKFAANVPIFVPITRDDCIPDLSVFDQADMMKNCDGACRADMTKQLFDAHIAHVTPLGGCSSNWHTANDVTFKN